jgi:RNA polymerase sigma-70 factor (ECF subfamily)
MKSVGLSETERQARLERLFEQHYAAVLAYGLRRAPRAVAEDVASETFVIASRRIDDVPAVALPWLYGVARRVLANERRAETRRDQLTRALELVADPGRTEAVEGAPKELLAALAQLAEADREALLLAAWEGLSSSEAAGVVGCSRVAMRARLSRARRRLVHILDAENPIVTQARHDSRAVPGGAECGVIERSS